MAIVPSRAGEYQLSVIQWGNGLGLRLPNVIAAKLELKRGDQVRIVLLGSRLMVEPLDMTGKPVKSSAGEIDPYQEGLSNRIKAIGEEVLEIQNHMVNSR